MAHVYSTAVAILYGASRLSFSDNDQHKVQKPTISQIESAYHGTWCELINPHTFFIVNVFHGFTIRHGKRLGETLKLPRLSSFKVSASVSEAATSRLGLVSDKILNVSVSSLSRRHGSRVSSRSRLRRSRAHLWL